MTLSTSLPFWSFVATIALALSLAACGGEGAYAPYDGSALDAGVSLDATRADAQLPWSCDDGERNGDETDVDCGGGSCAPCAVGQSCKSSTDCGSEAVTDWSECDPGADDCSELGTQTRTRISPTCDDARVCKATEREETRECTRVVDDLRCGGCPEGTFYDLEVAECLRWTECGPSGYVEAEGTDVADRVCAPCPTGTYSDEANAAECTPWTTCGLGELEDSPGTLTTDRTCIIEEWTRQFGSTIDDIAHAVAVGGDGSVVVAGTTHFQLPGQTRTGTFGTDVFVRKYDAAGTELWTRQFGSTSYDEGYAVAVANDGSVVVAGYTAGSLSGQTSAGSTDAFLRKYDAAGTELWTRQFGTSGSDVVNGVTVAAAGTVLVVGHTSGDFPGHASAGGQDAFVRAYDASGAASWTRQMGTTGSDEAQAVAVATSGSVVFTGRTSGTLPGQTNLGSSDVFVEKLDALGAVLWTRQLGTADLDDSSAVAVATDGSVLISGSTFGAFPGQASAGNYDAFVCKYDGAGNALWTRQLGTSGGDHGLGVAVAGDGSVLVGGDVAGALPGQTSAGGADAFVRRYDAAGTILSTRQLGTSGGDLVRSVAVAAPGGVAVAGNTTGTLPGQSSVGSSDAFVMRLVP